MMDQRERLHSELLDYLARERGTPSATGLTAHLIAAGWVQKAEVVEECAKIADSEYERVIGKQTDAPEGSLGSEVNKQIRMVALMLPEVAAAIRALAPPAVVDNTQGVG